MKAVCALLLVLALVLGASAYPKSRQINRRELENKLRMLLKPGLRDELDDNLARYIDTVVRGWILNGNEVLGLPVSDPLLIALLNINLNQQGLVLNGTVENVVITGISTFKVESVKTDLNALTAVIDISVAVIRLVGERYVLEGELLGGLLPVWGEGKFELDLNQATLNLSFRLIINNEGFVKLDELQLDVAIQSARANFENLLGGGTLGEVANDLISQELPGIVEDNKGPVLDSLELLIKELVNERVPDLTLDELLDLINNTPKKA